MGERAEADESIIPRTTGEGSDASIRGRLRVLYAGVSIAAVGLLALEITRDPGSVSDAIPAALVWLLAVALADLFSVPVWGSVVLSLSFPVLIAAGIVFPPAVAGLLALLGSGEPRELRREITFGRAAFNRSQIALSTMSAAFVFQWLDADPADWPRVLGITALALLSDTFVNLALVMLAVRLTTGRGVREISDEILLNRPAERITDYLSVGLMAPVLALLFVEAGTWGLLGVLGPVVLAHQLFSSHRELRDASSAVQRKSRALAEAVSHVAEERRQERLFVAGDLHDEVLQPLYKVHLMGQVLRRDLESGRLLDLDTDLPGLLEATEAAQTAIRQILRDLRSSTISSKGLEGTIRLFVAEFQERTGMELSLSIEDVRGSSLSELVAFQVVREGLTNIEKYSGARYVAVQVSAVSGDIWVEVRDDGCGFEPMLVDHAEHFGLQLMRERVEAIGGLLQVNSRTGVGTSLAARIPAKPQW